MYKKITDEPIEDDFLHAINYCIFGLIIVKEKPKDPFKKEVLIQKYEEVIKDVRDLFERKNHDYGEAWRDLCISSMVDFMLMKHLRGKNMHEIESLSDEMISEIFKDIMNYSVFCRIRIDEGTNALL